MSAPWGNVLADLATCLRFFSRFPLPAGARERPFAEAVALLPVAGLLIAACAAAPLAGCAVLGLPHGMAAVAAVAGGLLASGALHEDGLADTADGFGGGRTVERKLAIMRDSRIGTYGVLALAIALGWRIFAFAALLDRLPPGGAALLVLGAGAATRALALMPLCALPPARLDGLGHGAGRPAPPALATCAVLALVIGAGAPLLAGSGSAKAALACGLALAGAAAVTRIAARQIGGHTGDVAGAAQQAAEAGYLFALLAVTPG